MFRTDACVELISDKIMSRVGYSAETLKTLLDAVTITYDLPRERIVNAVKDEIDYLLERATIAVSKISETADNQTWLRQAKEALHTNTCYFPRAELHELTQQMPESELRTTLVFWIDKHKAFEKRLSWLLRPSTLSDIEQLDPIADCERIFHFISYDFRAEMKIFAVLYELRATVSANSALFFRSTSEFDQRSVRRIIDTVYLFANVLEWGMDSRRGQFAMNRINEIHGRYYIPNEGMRYVLDGIMFIPHEWNKVFGWRKFCEVEKLGWFHAFRKMGERMNISDLSPNFDEEYKWYLEHSQKSAYFSDVKKNMFDTIVTQVLAEYPAKVRPAVLTTILAGMDDVYRVTSGYPEPPKEVFDAIKAVFFTVGHASNSLPRAPWIRSLHSNPIYPYGYRIEELGVPRRTSSLPAACPFSGGMLPVQSEQTAPPHAPLPTLSWEEVRKHNNEDDLWIVIDGYVYDVTSFAKSHPGGIKVMMSQAGKDASRAFHKIGHSPEAQVSKLNFRIGIVKEPLPAMESQDERAAAA